MNVTFLLFCVIIFNKEGDIRMKNCAFKKRWILLGINILNGWYVEDIQIIEKYFEMDKEAELLEINL